MPGPTDKRIDIYGGKNPATLAAYGISEVAHCLQLPKTTVVNWVAGGRYTTRAGDRRFQPVIRIALPKQRLLSFQNLIEVHVLSAIRRQHGVTLAAVRRAVAFLRDCFKSEHPFYERQMLTDGTDLFVEELDRYVNVSREGQTAMKATLDAHLKRIERNPKGVPIRLYPFTTGWHDEAPDFRPVSIDPLVRFGRPTIAGTGVPTDVIADRFKGGDTPEHLADDYRLDLARIHEALRYEFPAAVV